MESESRRNGRRHQLLQNTNFLAPYDHWQDTKLIPFLMLLASNGSVDI